MLCALALCLLPVAGESALQIHTDQRTFDTRFAGTAVTPAPDESLPARDPFEPDIAQLPAAVQLPKETVAVHAIVAGSDPRALIEEAGRMRIVQVGDSVRSSTVRAITADGLMLADGSKLRLEANP